MRFGILASLIGGFALAFMAVATEPAEAAKSKMGCTVGAQKWDAVQGKCVARKAAPKAKKVAAKKAPAKKK
jgi:hypothetical protein